MFYCFGKKIADFMAFLDVLAFYEEKKVKNGKSGRKRWKLAKY
jgi:hypothetical protein